MSHDERPTFDGHAFIARSSLGRTLLPWLVIAGAGLQMFLYYRAIAFPFVVFVVGLGRGTSGRRRVVQKVRVDDAGLWIGEKLAAARAALRDAYVTTDEPMPTVVVGRSDGPSIDLAFDAPSDARAFAAAIAPISGTVVAGTVATGSAFLRILPLLAIAFVMFRVQTPLALQLLLVVAAVVFLLKQLLVTRVTVGSDGFEIATAVDRRFVPYGDVASMTDEAVALRDGRTVPLVRGRLQGPPSLSRTTHAELRTRALVALRERATAFHEDRGTLPAVPPDGEPVLGKAASYRDAARSPDDLLPLVESAATEPAVRVRIAASLVREAELDETQRRRLRVAVETTADPDVRRQLEEALGAARIPTHTP